MQERKQVEQVLVCAECGVVSDGQASGWRAYLGGDCELDDEPLEALVFCPLRRPRL